MLPRTFALTLLSTLGAASAFAAVTAEPTKAAAEPSKATAEPTKEQADFFENKIRPIFKENCYKCHSVEEGKSKGDLTLDTKAGTLKGGENGAIIVPGDVAKSPIVTAVTYLDKDLQMPPKGEKLTDQQIADITAWVKMGAPDPRKDDAAIKSKLSGLTDKARSHWAFQPVTKPTPPAVRNTAWPKTALDNFILAKLESQGMFPAPDATKETLLRRATYDLTGLPPSPQEIQAFVLDNTPQAFGKVVERLLASPAYGERWGRFWLDTARYSDTTGGDKKVVRRDDYRYAYAWTYRDWVIKAFNDDLPYDQFIVQQLAADRIPNNPPSNLAALGFITVGQRFPNVNDIINDRIDTVSKGFLGLTVACARCHDHMFDPIPTKDYYALHGVFASTIEPADKPIIGIPSQAQLADYEMQVEKVNTDNRNLYYQFLDREQGDFFKKIDGYLLVSRLGAGGKKKNNDPEKEKERIALLQKYNLDREVVNIYIRGARGRNDTIFSPFHRLAELSESEFAEQAPAILADITGEPASEFIPTNQASQLGQPAQLNQSIKPSQLSQPGQLTQLSQPNPPSQLDQLSKPSQSGQASQSGQPNKIHRSSQSTTVNPLVANAFRNSKPKSIDDVAAVYKQLFASLEPQRKAYLAANAKALQAPVTGFEPSVVELLQYPMPILPASQVNPQSLREFTQKMGNKLLQQTRFEFAKLNELELTHPGAPARAMLVADAPRPKDSPVFIRGQQETRGDIVPRHFLEILSPERKPVPFSQGSGRLELAQDIASKSNPLTARVIVNRVWMHHFGEGFVRTMDDLGTQSEKPSHQELLDYLASYFMERGWSLKSLHRAIMLSHVYQESSQTNKKFEQMDPENRLLWRANIRKLDFEALRDSLLVMSGNLDRTVGGKPINLTDEPYSYRRSVYGYIDRGDLPELMQQFDFSDPDMPNSKRASTTVPQQALFLMNSAMSVDVARRIVARPEVYGANDTLSRVIGLYRVIFQRNPTQREISLGIDFVAAEARNQPKTTPTAQTADDNGKPNARLTANNGKKGGKRRAEATRPIENEGEIIERKPLTPWETYAQALLFSNEASYIN
jgi:mono/diheme cytochrome c family protein